MQIGGAGIYCQMNISGVPSLGFIPRSSQSVGVIWRNKLSTLTGFKSSIAFFTCFSSSLFPFLASANDLSNITLLSGGFFLAAVDILNARYLSWTIFKVPAFFTVPLIDPQ